VDPSRFCDSRRVAEYGVCCALREPDWQPYQYSLDENRVRTSSSFCTGVLNLLPKRYTTVKTTFTIKVCSALLPLTISLFILFTQPASTLPAVIRVAILAPVVNPFTIPVPGIRIAGADLRQSSERWASF
jgi:uncharacterized membrane protein